MKEMADELDFAEIKNFSAKETVKRMRRHATDREQTPATDTGYGSYPQYSKTLKTNTLTTRRTNTLTDTSPKVHRWQASL